MPLLRASLTAASLALLLGACGQQVAEPDPTGSTGESGVVGAVDAADAYAALPEGWRWESYLGVLVGVPDGFGWTSTDQRLTQWCTDGFPDEPEPAVGRPGASTMAFCGPEADSSALDNSGEVVAFDVDLDDPAASEDRTRGDRVTRDLGVVRVIVQTDPDLRRRVLQTITQVRGGARDPYGCPVDDVVSSDPADRPDAGPLPETTDRLSGVAVCTYAILQAEMEYAGPTLLASRALDADAAAAGVAALRRAPLGGGPDSPRTCSEDVRYGEEITVLRVSLEDGREQRTVLRYSGCDHHGIDDGDSVRTLTAAALEPFLQGANRPTSYNGRLRDVMDYPAAD